jgi:hypothetical protein
MHWNSSEQGREDYEQTEQNGVMCEGNYAAKSLGMRDSFYRRCG